MKILILNSWYYPNMMGGAEQFVKILCENLAKENSVAVFTVDAKEKFIKERINNVLVYRSTGNKYSIYNAYFNKCISKLKKINQKYHEIFNNSISADLISTIRDFNPDIVHFNCISGISLYSFKVIHKLNIPSVFTIHNYSLIYPADEIKAKSRFFNSLFIFWYRKLERKYLKYIDFITAPSDFTLQKHINYNFFPKFTKRKVIPNCTFFDFEELKKIIEMRKNKKSDEINFLYAGWLTKSKGIIQMINAFNKINNSYVKLNICGDGPLKEYVLNSCKENSKIKYLGKLNSDQMNEQYRLNDVLIVPSIWDEPFGLVIIEAFSKGLPVIASNHGGISEIISTCEGGKLVDPENLSQFTNTIEEFIQNKKYNKYYDNILKGINVYSIDNHVSSYTSLYNEVLSTKKGGKI